MTLSTTDRRKSHSGNGVTTGFSFPYKFLADADLVVVIINDSTGVRTTQTLTTHYTVTGAGDAAGGTVTMITAPASGETLVIYREMTLTQGVDYISGDDFPAETHETALDRLTMIAQQSEDKVGRAVRLSDTVTDDPNLEIRALAADRAGKVFAFDSDGDLVLTTPIGTYKGADATTTTAAYVERDLVKSTTTGQLNNVYIAIQDSPSGTLLTNTSYWVLIIDAVSAAASASAASTSASNAATSESNAATSATTATTQASNASTSATNAATSETNAAASLAACQTIEDNFDDRYLGSKASDPTLDNDGDALTDGALYFNTTVNLLKVYDLGTTTWIAIENLTLAGLTDVTLASITADEILVWTGTAWTNKTLAEAGIEPADATIVKDADIGVTVQAYDADTAKLDVDQSWTGSQRSADVVDNDGSFSLDAGNNFSSTPTGNITLTFTNQADGQSGFILLDNSGGHTVSAHANTKVDANFLSTVSTAGKYLVSYYSDGTDTYVANSGALS